MASSAAAARESPSTLPPSARSQASPLSRRGLPETACRAAPAARRCRGPARRECPCGCRVTGGALEAVRTVTHSWKAMACSRRSSGVDSDRCAIAAVSISAPPVSSTVIMKPRSTATSRIRRVLVTPPSREIFSVSPSATPAAVDLQHVLQRGDGFVEHHRLVRAPAAPTGIRRSWCRAARRCSRCRASRRRIAAPGTASSRHWRRRRSRCPSEPRRRRRCTRSMSSRTLPPTLTCRRPKPSATILGRVRGHRFDRAVRDDLVELGRLALARRRGASPAARRRRARQDPSRPCRAPT